MSPRQRLVESIEWAAFLLLLAGILIALCAVDPSAICAPRVC
jgi:hypothetical protein